MELKVFWRTLRRRWYLTAVVLALMVGATAFVVTEVGPTYEAEGSALVFPPASSIKVEGRAATAGNPYLELAGVNQARDVVIRTLKSRTVQKQWGEDFPGMEYEATPDFTNSAPIILFTVNGGTPEGTTAGLDDLMSRVPAILLDLQEGLGLESEGMVTARKLTQDAVPAVQLKGQIRAGLLTAAATGVFGLLLLALIDSLLIARSRARVARKERHERAEAEAEARSRAEAEARAEEEAARAAADPDPDPSPVYTYRFPPQSELAVAPARSKWLRPAPSADPSRNGHRFRTAPSGKPRSKVNGRNR